MSDLQKANVGDIPLVWLEPERAEERTLVIWLPGFSGTKEAMESYLVDLAKAGFVALSFDPHQHGERMIESLEELRTRVRGNLRRYFWPILAQTAEDASRVIDWAIPHLGVGERVGMGGISAGGDASVAAAGVDPRIGVVAAGVATPDWLRPGSFEPPGEPDEAAQARYDRRNPLTNLEAYRHRPAISFQCGAQDEQVPPSGALRFAKALREEIYATSPERLEVVLHEGVPHRFTDESWRNCVAWFQRHLTPGSAASHS